MSAARREMHRQMALIRALVVEMLHYPVEDRTWQALRAQVREERQRLVGLLRNARRARRATRVVDEDKTVHSSRLRVVKSRSSG